MLKRIFTLAPVALCAFTFALQARDLPVAKPESAGMSAQRLARIDTVVQRYVTSGQIVGAVTLVIRDGKVVQQGVYGNLDPNAGTPMRGDALFRLASESKPITAAAILTLVE